MLFGKISNLNYTEKTFTFTTKGPDGNEIVFKATYRDATKFMRDQKMVKAEDFIDGEEVTVAGNINPEQKTIEAFMVVLGQMKPGNPGGPGRN